MEKVNIYNNSVSSVFFPMQIRRSVSLAYMILILTKLL